MRREVFRLDYVDRSQKLAGLQEGTIRYRAKVDRWAMGVIMAFLTAWAWMAW